MRTISHGPGFILSGPDAPNQSVIVKGKVQHFDFDRRFGPLLTDAEGEPLAKQPTSERHPFWAPFEVWLAQWRKENPPVAPRPHPSAHLDRRLPHNTGDS